MQYVARIVALFILIPGCALGGDAESWPSFRGSHASGVASGTAPTTWNVETGKNVLWKTALPGLGHSGAIVSGDRLFVTTAVSGRTDAGLKVGLYGDIEPVEDQTVHEWKVYCLDRRTGKILWERTAHRGVPKIKRHTKATHANSTPATDGNHVVAFFGSEGLYCYDFDGKLLWTKDLGPLDSGYYKVPQAQWGFGSSPVIHDGRVIVQCDVQGGGFLAAFDVKDGREIWRTARKDVPTWSTPTVHVGAGRAQVIVNGHRQAGGYDLATGKSLWSLAGGGDIPVPTPVVAGELVFLMSAHGGPAPIWAVRLSAVGDVTLKGDEIQSAAVAWSQPTAASYMQTPLVYGDYLYVCRDNGALTCFEAKTGKEQYRGRLGSGSSGFTASGVAADGKLYYTSETGDVYVVRAGKALEVLAQNPLGEISMATPAISRGAIYFRTEHHVVAVGEKSTAEGK